MNQGSWATDKHISPIKYSIIFLRFCGRGGKIMQLQNSYIFLPNPFKKEDASRPKQDNLIRVKTEDSFVSCLKAAFPSAAMDMDNSLFFKTVYCFSIDQDGISCTVTFLVNSVVHNYYLDVIVSGKSKAQIIKGLEYVQNAIDASSIPQNYIEIISYDAISEYYCNKIYPKLNELERNLRKLLFTIYVVNFGLDYYTSTVTGELQSKAKGVISVDAKTDKDKLKSIYRATNKEIEEITRWQRFFYSFEFSDIQKLLFSKNWTSIDEQDQAKFLEANRDLSQLTDKELRVAFTRYAPKSDWERFFNEKIPELDVEGIIEEIRKSRNSIAHCKFFYRDEYESCKKAIHCLNRAIISAIRIAEEKDFSNQNSKYIADAMAGVLERIGEIAQTISATVKPALQAMGRISETISHYFELFQKCDLSGPLKILSAALIAPNSTNNAGETSETGDKGKDSDDGEV